ncbi:MAG: peptidylprolyl isomerase [Alphaproteobacteria bacterium]|nr:peptidylprolyl isomerase [Alphaproteobacteria bacterium]|tara:strand:+ start:22 stop:1083 length:1062 start_codon:yes stop_codon:yes gene_type:complete
MTEKKKNTTQKPAETSSRNNNSGLIIGLVVAVVVVLALGAYFMSGEEMNKVSNTEQATSSDMDQTAQNDTDTADTDIDEADVGNAGMANEATSGNVIAEVNGEPITQNDVDEFVAQVPQLQQQPAEQVMPVVREELITAKVVDERVAEANLENNPEVQKRMQQAREGIMRSVYLEQMVQEEMTDERLREEYNAFKEQQSASSQEQVRARHILVATEEEADNIITQLEEGADFNELATEESTDTASGATGGDLGYFTKAQMVPEFSEAAFSMEEGEVSSEPVKSQFGYHIIKVEDKRMQPAPTFEETKPFLEVQVRRKILEEKLAEWREEADVKIYNAEPATGASSMPESTTAE